MRLVDLQDKGKSVAALALRRTLQDRCTGEGVLVGDETRLGFVLFQNFQARYDPRMPLMTLDIALLLPDEARRWACEVSAILAERMNGGSHFVLGEPFPGSGHDGPCEPHVTIEQFPADPSQIPELQARTQRLSRLAGPIRPDAGKFRLNPQGAVEWHFPWSQSWQRVQNPVLESVEPVRAGRLRESDPAGDSIAETVERLRKEDPGGQELAQYLAYGFNEIGPTTSHPDWNRFSPHITLAWPKVSGSQVDFSDLTPPPALFKDGLTTLALYGMDRAGTCTVEYGRFELTGPSLDPGDHDRGAALTPATLFGAQAPAGAAADPRASAGSARSTQPRNTPRRPGPSQDL
ncbi:hypothetical protein ABZX12_41090 [Kribbella sp. NPDC003505]|uniref:hypothetical protein n=1 Tax=Kribbella sp. NPDC003505 TaxID=3154448 RepID=UPI0033A8978D